MKIILVSVGTRGDVEPFVAIGEMLKERGHRVICAFPGSFEKLAIAADLEFASLGEKFIALLESDAGRAAMGGSSGFKKLKGTIQLAINQKEANLELMQKQREVIEYEDPDCILYNGKSMYPILWHLRTKRKIIFISPLPYMHYVKGHSHIGFNSNFGEFLNKLTFSIAHFGLTTAIRMAEKSLKMKERVKKEDIKRVVTRGDCIYSISPSLFPRPVYWPENRHVLGYFQKNPSHDWVPPDDLLAFIENHPKILFVTFGSMTNLSPEKNTKDLLKLLSRHQIPTIINTAAGGLVKPNGFSDPGVLFVSRVPYDWLFPKVYATIHHGGSGTTHLALKYGCASMIIPHIFDQFVWDKLQAKMGVGPKGVKIGKLASKLFETKVLDLISNPSYKKKAQEIGQQMRQEDFKEDLYRLIVE